jgi:hypothetical protein
MFSVKSMCCEEEIWQSRSVQKSTKIFHFTSKVRGRVSFETSLDSNQPKLEPKLASPLSKTKCWVRLFHFYIATESFDVSIESKQTEDQPK